MTTYTIDVGGYWRCKIETGCKCCVLYTITKSLSKCDACITDTIRQTIGFSAHALHLDDETILHPLYTYTIEDDWISVTFDSRLIDIFSFVVRNGNISALRHWICSGVCLFPPHRKRSYLWLALHHRRPYEIVEELINCGADINEQIDKKFEFKYHLIDGKIELIQFNKMPLILLFCCSKFHNEMLDRSECDLTFNKDEMIFRSAMRFARRTGHIKLYTKLKAIDASSFIDKTK